MTFILTAGLLGALVGCGGGKGESGPKAGNKTGGGGSNTISNGQNGTDDGANGGANGNGGNGGTDTGGVDAGAQEWAGGTPIPDGKYKLNVPWYGSSTISFVSKAGEEINGQVAMDGDGSFGTVDVDTTEGIATGTLTVPVKMMRTGFTLRDGHLQKPEWLDAANHPNIELRNLTCTRVLPTVWKATGELVVRGKAQPLESYVNVRFYKDFPTNQGPRDLFKISTTFKVDLKAHGLTASQIGTPAVQQVWTVNVALFAMKVE